MDETGRGGRRGRARDGHRHEPGRHAGEAVRDGGLHRPALERERAQAHLERREDRAGPQRVRPAGDGARELDRALRLERVHGGHELDVLARRGQLRPQLVQRPDRDGDVAGLRRLPQEADLGDRVRDPRDRLQVREGGGAARSRVEVEHLGRAAVGGQPAVAAVEDQVGAWVAGGERVRMRGRGERRLDVGTGESDPFRGVVHADAARREVGPGGGRPHDHPHPVEDLERRLVHARDARLVEDRHRVAPETEREDTGLGRGRLVHRGPRGRRRTCGARRRA